MSSRIWVATGLVSLLIVALLMADRTQGDVEPPRAAESFTQADVDRISKRVETLRGLEFRERIRPQFLDREQATELARELSKSSYSDAQRREDEEAIKLVGLLKPDESLSDALGAVEGEQILGFYDPKSKQMVVVTDVTSGRALLEITLAHELTHALEDQHFGIDEPKGGSDDERVAERAMIEGSATELMERYTERYVSADGLLEVATSSGGGTQLPKYVENGISFPYLGGQKFVETFVPQGTDDQGWLAFDSLMRGKRPTTTEQVLHPRRFAFGERPRPVWMPDVAALLGNGWARADSTTVGEFDIGQIFEIVGRGPDPSAAEGWGGGRFELWLRKGEKLENCEPPCVDRVIGVLELEWDSKADAKEANVELVGAIEEGLHGRKIAGRKKVWASRGGAIGMRSAGRETTIVFAPSENLAVDVLGAASLR